ncbi:MAG: leucine-rich repeat protein [Oscillospiraceae bacterium]|nr:leucine-rich repeat protein [Oscillospiraceae bacterium]
MKRLKCVLCIMLSLVLCLGMIPGAAAAGEMPFTDVPSGAWFYNDVLRAYQLKLIDGTSATTFSPEKELSYCEAVKLAACMHQRYTQGKVTLTNSPTGNWYDSYVAYAEENYIIWNPEEYDWNAPASRGGYMEIFANALPEEALQPINSIPWGSIPDVPEEEPQSGAIYILYQAGVVQGVDSEHNCLPDKSIKRQEVAAILTRMMDPGTRIRFDMTLSDEEAMCSLNEWIDGDEDGFKGEDGYIALADWPELMEYMADSAEYMKEMGLISEYECSEEDAYILYTLKSGLLVEYDPPIREYLDYAGSKVISIEPCSDDTKGNWQSFASNKGTAINLQKKICDLGIGYERGSSVLNDGVTIAEVKRCFESSAGGVLLWFGHGAKSMPALKIGEKYDESKHASLRDSGEILVNDGDIFLKGTWFRNNLKSNCLVGTFVLLGACYSWKDSSLTDALGSKGAACVIGSKERIHIPKLFGTAEALITGMTEADKNGQYTTVSEAMKKPRYVIAGFADVFHGKLEIAFGGDWRLENRITASFVVLDASNKKPIANATVACINETVQTDSNGRCSIGGLDMMRDVFLEVSADGYETKKDSFNPAAGGDISIFLYPVMETSTVTVTDYTTGEAISGATVEFRTNLGVTGTAITDTDGIARLYTESGGAVKGETLTCSVRYGDYDPIENAEYRRSVISSSAEEWPFELNVRLKLYPSSLGNISHKGTCGDCALWALNDEGVLHIFGTGAMESYDFIGTINGTHAPWYGLKDGITKAVVEKGVTEIGSCAFQDCENMEYISMADSVNKLGVGAFQGCSALKSVAIRDGTAAIPSFCFRYCSSLKAISIPNTVTEIAYYAFTDVSDLQYVYYGGSKAQWDKINIDDFRDGNKALNEAELICNSSGLLTP